MEGSFVQDFIDDTTAERPAMTASYSASLTALTHSLEAARYMITLSPAFGATSVGSFSMYLFMSSKALSTSRVHRKSFFSRHPFSVLKNGRDFSALLDKNLLRAVSLPFKLCTSLMVLGRLRILRLESSLDWL
ncbi:hypothetical protein Tco_1318166 [Tanacetum coccineum]